MMAHLTVLERHYRQQRARLTAADALAEKAQQLSRGAIAATNAEPEFTIDPQDLAELDAALRQYREACDK